MPPSRVWLAFILASASLPAAAGEDKKAQIDCGAPKEEIEQFTYGVCNDADLKKNSKWGMGCPDSIWRLEEFILLSNKGVKGLLADIKGSSDHDKLVELWNAKTKEKNRLELLKIAEKDAYDDPDYYNKFLQKYSAAKAACEAVKKDTSKANGEAFAKAISEFDDAAGTVELEIDDKFHQEPANSTLNRLNKLDPDRKPPADKELAALRARVDSWQKSMKDFSDFQQAKADLDKKAGEDFAKKQAGFRAKMDGGPGQGAAVEGELQAAFDRMDMKGVKVKAMTGADGKAMTGADGTVMVDVEVSAEDYGKLTDEQRKRLENLGIKPPKPGEKSTKNNYTIPGASTKKSLDQFESTLFAKDAGSSTILRYATAKDALAETSGREFAEKAVGGTSVAKLAEDAHSRKELDEKMAAARSKASAQYMQDDQAAVKDCLGMKEGETPSPQMMSLLKDNQDPKCAEARRQALAKYKASQDALDIKQSDADQGAAMAAETSLGAYRSYAKSIMVRDSGVSQLSNDELSLRFQKCNKGKGGAAGAQAGNLKSQAKSLDDSIKPELAALDKASAKVKDVSAGKAKMAEVKAISEASNVVPQALDSSDAAALFGKRHAAMMGNFDKLYADFDPPSCGNGASGL